MHDTPATWDADLVQLAASTAAAAHGDQRMLTGAPYLLHVASVAMETAWGVARDPSLDATLALCCAWLHDTVEDTETTVEDIESRFGPAIARGVSALTKDPSLAKPDAMRDSLCRLRAEPASVRAVKLADRIVNLQSPPDSWSRARRGRYADEGELILAELGEACPPLADRLRQRIRAYRAAFA
jgi:(p)ppGpp synthase/HD superfamily hydrolase